MVLTWWSYPLIMLAVFVPMVAVYAYESRKERRQRGTLPCLGRVDETVYCADSSGHPGPCGVWYVFVTRGVSDDDE